MADYYDTGTISVPINGKTVTGTGVTWTGIARAGDTLACDGRYIPIAAGGAATTLELLLPAPVAITNRPYAILFTSPSRTAAGQALDDAQRLLEAFEIVAAMRPEYEVQSATLNAPPATPVTSDMYLIAATPTGAWAGYAGHVARWTGTGWAFTAPQFGMRAVARDTGRRWARSLTAWALSPDLVSALAVSGNIADLLGDTFLRTLIVNGQLVGSTNIIVRSGDTSSNAHLWFRNPDNTNRALIYSDINSNILLFRTWPVPGASTYFDMSLRPSGEVFASNNVPSNPYALTSKAYVDGELAKQLSADAAVNGLGSTIFAANVSGSIVGTGATIAGASLRYARLETTGAAIFGSSTPSGGTWRNCSADVPNNAFGLFRRIV